ncbi:DUF6191 domain-containing protein [Streptomyces sp. NPDC047108]|uniref:DUF6191 domain-containing protein n=1 Tax=Streptomyces sp. NPDC047108 TaxID=3155025 RepID=UPI0033E416A1
MRIYARTYRAGPARYVLGGPLFNIAEELFAPGRQHTEEERQKHQLCIDDIGDSDPARGPIDLSSGKVVVRQEHPDDDSH